jgi:hypothetical protein
MISPIQDIRDDPLVANAREVAYSERATLIDERHVLIALLNDSRSGTMTELARALGPEKLDRIRNFARSKRPNSVVEAQSVPITFPDGLL